MEIIGTRPYSAFRVDAGYFKDRPWLGLRDLHTNGPLAVVEDYTDNVLEDYALDYDADSPTYRQVIKKPAARSRSRRSEKESE